MNDLVKEEKKKLRVFILVNTLQSVTSFVYANHIEFFVQTAKRRPDIDFRFFTPHRMSIDNARNTAADLAMKMECDYLMFIDDDVLIPPDTLEKLLVADKDIIAGLVIIRGLPFNVMAFRWQDVGVKHEERVQENEKRSLIFYNDLPLEAPCTEGHERYVLGCEPCTKVKLQELVPCDALGFSCCLIKTDVLHQLTTPYFITGKHHTEDVYFCMKVINELEPRPSIYMHTGIRCGHLLNPEPIEWDMRPRMTEFYRPETELQKKSAENPGRNALYLERCLAKLENVEEVKVDGN